MRDATDQNRVHEPCGIRRPRSVASSVMSSLSQPDLDATKYKDTGAYYSIYPPPFENPIPQPIASSLSVYGMHDDHPMPQTFHSSEVSNSGCVSAEFPGQVVASDWNQLALGPGYNEESWPGYRLPIQEMASPLVGDLPLPSDYSREAPSWPSFEESPGYQAYCQIPSWNRRPAPRRLASRRARGLDAESPRELGEHAQSDAFIKPLRNMEDPYLSHASGSATRNKRNVTHPHAPYTPFPSRLPPHNPRGKPRQQSPASLSPGSTSGDSSDGGLGMLSPDSPEWRLTPAIYRWMFAVMYPRRRANKSQPTPSGPCLFCESVCKRAGILQQHLTILHRQRIARKYIAGLPYSVELALAFVVAQHRSVTNRDQDALETECSCFLKTLGNSSDGLEPLHETDFPLLREAFRHWAIHESWVGVQCALCGVWATRPVALEEHAAVCVGSPR